MSGQLGWVSGEECQLCYVCKAKCLASRCTQYIVFNSETGTY
eukprot:COSAG01_NODE_8514_length_2758_cov_11.722828_4_plen_42_part_00